MELDDLFGDLEAQFENKLEHGSWNTNCKKLQIRNCFGAHAELIAPIIGEDFIAGLDTLTGDWVCFEIQIVTQIRQRSEDDDDLPLLRNQSIDFKTFIATIDRPIRLTAIDRNGKSTAFNLLAIHNQFLVCENSMLIPISSITQLRILGANSWL